MGHESTELDRGQEGIIERIAARPDGDVLNIIQAASELQGTVEQRLTDAYEEIVEVRGDLEAGEEAHAEAEAVVDRDLQTSEPDPGDVLGRTVESSVDQPRTSSW